MLGDKVGVLVHLIDFRAMYRTVEIFPTKMRKLCLMGLAMCEGASVCQSMNVRKQKSI